jgi:alpha-D-ribose 1-methylphosphonate 5-triphosphate synthase subunit PhnH
MFAPHSPNSRFRTLLSKTQPARVLVLMLALGITAMSLGATSSSAGTFGQALIAKAAAMIGVNVAPSAQALNLEAAETQDSSMATERRGHTATRLQDGRVLIAGGENSSGALNGTEVFDPATGAFSAAGNMSAARVDHSATLLADGRVLLAGGRDGAGSLATTEIFDPATGTFATGPSMSVARAGHSATLFADGRIFIAGGDANGTAEVLSASLSESTVAGAMSGPRSMHSAALMQDGRVLIVGGRDGDGDALASGEIFGTGFSLLEKTLKLARVRPHLRVLFDGKVQIIGGNNDGSMEIYDPAEGTFGAYAHVLPESDPCTGLHGQVLASQTRAALFHTGSPDELLDRSGHTMTELGGQALVIGGVNGAGAFLSSSASVASSSAAISTDKMDYAPGETATISGRGFQAGEVVRVKIHEDPHTPQERGFDVTADADGNFSGQYLVMDYDLDMKFIVGARGLTSGRTAQTTFTDANPQVITVAAPTSATVLQGVTANYGNVTVQVGGNTSSCQVTLGTTALPAGAAAVFGTNPNTTTGADIVTSLSVTTSGSTPAGTYTFQVTGTNGSGCQGPGATPSNTLTLIVNSATVNTTTSVSNATATYGDSSVTLNATVTPASGPAVNSGSVTFTVKQGPTTVGVATVDNTIVAGAASVSYALPAGTAAGGYTIEASYSGATGFNASSGTGSLTINTKGLTITASNKTKTYGDAVTFNETTPSTDFSVAGLINSDTVDSITLFSTGAAATATVADSPYAIVPSAAVGTGLDNYEISYLNGSLSVEARDLTITASNRTKTYGDAVTFNETTPSTDFSVVGLINSDTVDSITLFSTGAAATATVADSPYAIVPSVAVGTGLNNYEISYLNGSLSVEARDLTITASNRTKTYGDAVTFVETTPSTDFSVVDLVNSDTVNSITLFSTGAAATATVADSPYAIVPSAAVGTGLDNYEISYVKGSLTVEARDLTITASNRTKTYGDAVTFVETTPSTDFSVVGLVNSDTVASITLFSTGAAATATVADSPYAIVPSAAVGTGLDNYDIGYVNGSLTVNQKPLTITASNRTKTYGDTVTFDETTPSTDFSVGAGLINGDTVNSITLTSAGAAAGASVAGSPYSIVPSAAVGSGLDNYAISYVNGALTVDKASLTITASSHTIIFNDPVPTITASYSGFVAGDDATDLTVQPTCSTTYTVGSLIGSYPTKCENAASGNYNISYVGGTVTVLTACSAFNGFLSPIGGAVELGTGGSFFDPVRAFKLNSTIPVKFNAVCFGAPLTTGIHTLEAIKYSNSTTSDAAIDATPTDAATIGNQFRWTGSEWHFNVNTKALGGSAQGKWLLKATLFDGSTYTVWIEIKK